MAKRSAAMPKRGVTPSPLPRAECDQGGSPKQGVLTPLPAPAGEGRVRANRCGTGLWM